MRILQISTFDTKGGAARVAFTLHTELRAMGHETSMFVHHKYSTDTNVFNIPQSRLERFLAKIFATDVHFWRSNFILNTPQYKNADIIHLHNIHGNFFSLQTFKKMAREKKVVWTLHDMWAITGHNAWGYDGKNSNNGQIPSIEVTPALMWNNRDFLFRVKQKFYKENQLTFVPVSHWLEDELERGIPGSKNITMIHNGIDTQIFKPTEKNIARKNLDLPLDAKIVIFVSVGGKNNIQKGWPYTKAVIDSLKNRKDVLFVCIGGKNIGGSNTDQNVRYLDYLSDQKKLAEYYSAADIFLFTSIAENFPLVVLEAMACGAAIASFDVGGTKEAVTHLENGYVAKYRDVDDIIKGVTHLLTHGADEAAKIFKANVEKARSRFTSQIMVKKYEQLYKQIKKSDEI